MKQVKITAVSITRYNDIKLSDYNYSFYNYGICVVVGVQTFNLVRSLRAPGVPMLASTATVTDVMRKEVIEKLEMDGCKVVSNKQNIFYSV